MVDMSRRTFLKLSLSAAAVATLAPQYVIPDSEAVEAPALGDAQDLLGSYDSGATFFKLKGKIVARLVGDEVEFDGFIFAPKRGIGGQLLRVQHPESGIWLPVS